MEDVVSLIGNASEDKKKSNPEGKIVKWLDNEPHKCRQDDKHRVVFWGLDRLDEILYESTVLIVLIKSIHA